MEKLAKTGIAATLFIAFIICTMAFSFKDNKEKPTEKNKEVIAINSKEDFDKTIKKGITLVDFWATWCGPCIRQAPTLKTLAKEMGNDVTFVKVDVDKNKELARKYKIRNLPTLVIFKNGIPVKTLIGLRTKAEIKNTLEKYTK